MSTDPIPAPTAQRLVRQLLAWFDEHGRHDLPWQHPRSPYRVWLAEVMLQQTQVQTVRPYFERFVAALPDFDALATAKLDDVLALWAGLGYYARARNLHRAAQTVVAEHGGEFPRDLDAAMALPGIGRSTAGAVLAQAYGLRHAILDGNVKRVLARLLTVPGWPGDTAVQKTLWRHSEALTPANRLADYTQAIMDLGATVCRRRQPDCGACPWRTDCAAHAQGLTGALPAPRPKRRRPLRRAHLPIVLDSTGRVLLQRRPPAGLWGGLWTPVGLELNANAAPEPNWLADLQPSTSLPDHRHGFTHFELLLAPRLYRAPAYWSGPEAGAVADAPAPRWCNLATETDWPALPAPIKTLLRQARAALVDPQTLFEDE